MLRKEESQGNPAHPCSRAPSWREDGWGGKSSQSLRSRMNASGTECQTTPRAWAEIRRARSLSFFRTRTQLLWEWAGKQVTGRQERSRNQAPSKHPCPCPGSALTTQDPTFPALHMQPQQETQCSKQVGQTRGRIRPATIEATHKAPVRYKSSEKKQPGKHAEMIREKHRSSLSELMEH